MKTLKEVRFEKKGHEFKVELVDTGYVVRTMLTVDGIRTDAKPVQKSRGWCYEAYNDDICMKLFGNKKGLGNFFVLHDSAKEIRELKERYIEEKDRKKREAILSGEKKIKASWHDGEYLSGWQVFGKAAELLEKIGAVKYISGWGYKLRHEIVEKFGETFAYQQAEEFTRPEREAKAARKADAEAKRQAIFDKARETGEKQELNRYSEPCNDPREECDVDNVIEYALPNGKLEVVRYHTW